MSLDFNIATFVVGIMSLIGVIANIVMTTINNRKKRYTDLITQRRLKTFQHIIDCSTTCIKCLYGAMAGGCDETNLVQTYVENKSQIFYNTNYKAPAEKELRDALTALQDLLVGYVEYKDTLTKTQKNRIFDAMKKGIDYYQTISSVYCKCEWVRIKETTLSVKESGNTTEDYFRRVKEIENELKNNKKALFDNTFDKIVK